MTDIWLDAWVNLVLVDSSINRSIGAMLERDPLGVNKGASVIHANLEFLLKLLCKPSGKMRRENLQQYFDEAGERFLSDIASLDDLVEVNNASGFLTDIAMDNGLQNLRRNFVVMAAGC